MDVRNALIMSAVSARRIAAEVRDLAKPSHRFTARPVRDDDLREWHFTLRGAPDSDFAGGLYHGRIQLPADYPLSPPSFYFITPSGRFETGVKICLSMSAFHPESWSPTWSIRTMLEGQATNNLTAVSRKYALPKFSEVATLPIAQL